jgi:hypothetical protein
MSTPRANHSQVPVSRPSSADTLPHESEDEDELLSVEEWSEWFKTTEHYKELISGPGQPVMTRVMLTQPNA